MGVSIALQKALARKLLGRSAKSIDELAVSLKAADKTAFSRMDQEVLKEFDLTQGALDKVDETLNASVGMQAQLRALYDEANELSRRAAITDPKAEPTTYHQANSPEEFSHRLANQWTPDYASRAIAGSQSFNPDVGASTALEILNNRVANDAIVETFTKQFDKIPRYSARLKEWQGDSPYKMQFHVDRITDTRNPDVSIQFTDAREIGNHGGSVAASEGVIGGANAIEEGMKLAGEHALDIKAIAAELGMSPKALDLKIATATNDFYLAKFNKTDGTGIWDDLKPLFDQYDEIMGATAGTGRKLLNEIRDLPTPNTTPYYFRGVNGLLLDDTGGFSPRIVGDQLLNIFNNDVDMDIIEAALKAGSRPKVTKALTDFIESKGYDHITYFNTVEDKGSLSIINWKPDLELSPWDPILHGGNRQSQAQAASSFVLGVFGLGVGHASIREEE